MNAQQLLDKLTQAVAYKDLQAALKAAKAEGYKIDCKLNASKENLEIARNTLVAQLNAHTEVSAEVEQLAATYTEAITDISLQDVATPESGIKEISDIALAKADEIPNWKKEAIALAADQLSVTPEPEIPQPELELASSIFNPVPSVTQPLVTAKWAWEYASRRAAADIALTRRITSDALATASLALQIASRAVAV